MVAEVEVIDSFRFDEGRFTSRLGGVLTAAYELNDKNRINFRALVNRFADDRTRVDFGKTENQRDPALKPPEFTRQWLLRWVQEQLALGQLSGEHDFDWVRLDWRSALSRTTRNEPDTRYATYQGPVDSLKFTSDSLGGQRITNVTRQELSDSMFDVTLPFGTALPFTDVWRGLPAKFRFGGAYAYRKARFTQRRFVFTADNATQNTEKPPEDLFAPDQLEPSAGRLHRGDPTFRRLHRVAADHRRVRSVRASDRPRQAAGAGRRATRVLAHPPRHWPDEHRHQWPARVPRSGSRGRLLRSLQHPERRSAAGGQHRVQSAPRHERAPELEPIGVAAGVSRAGPRRVPGPTRRTVAVRQPAAGRGEHHQLGRCAGSGSSRRSSSCPSASSTRTCRIRSRRSPSWPAPRSPKPGSMPSRRLSRGSSSKLARTSVSSSRDWLRSRSR